MLDRRVRALISPALESAGRRLANAGVRPGLLTASGFAVGAGACTAAAFGLWPLALALWLANRLLDGLDGPVARARGATAAGGFFDIVSDFAVYGGFVAGVAIAEPAARLACVVLLAAYYLSGTALLAQASLVDRGSSASAGDGRSLRFAGGLAEGTETVVVYVLFCLLPDAAATIAWVFAAAVGFTAVQRLVAGARLLSRHAVPSDPPPTEPIRIGGSGDDLLRARVRRDIVPARYGAVRPE